MLASSLYSPGGISPVRAKSQIRFLTASASSVLLFPTLIEPDSRRYSSRWSASSSVSPGGVGGLLSSSSRGSLRLICFAGTTLTGFAGGGGLTTLAGFALSANELAGTIGAGAATTNLPDLRTDPGVCEVVMPGTLDAPPSGLTRPFRLASSIRVPP